MTGPRPSPALADGSYPLNCWYVAATSDEVGPALLPRTLLDSRVVLFRPRGGAVSALEDRCAHRGAPLSLGALDNDEVVCGYHGFRYDSAGACVGVPSQRNVPYGPRVRSFPVREKAPFVWIWPGDPARSRGVDPPDVPELADPGWATVGGRNQFDVNYLLLHDNALDRTHFPFLHGHSIHRGYVEDPPPLRIEVAETTVSYTRTFAPAPLADWQHEATGLPAGQPYVQRESGTFVSPALHLDQMDIVGPDNVFRGLFVRAFTPVDRASTLVFWLGARNYARDDSSVSDRLRAVYEDTMTEDQPMLEAIQANTGGSVSYGLSAQADAAAIRAYQIIDAMLAEERGRPASARPIRLL